MRGSSFIQKTPAMTYDSFQPLLQWIAAHPTWAGFAVFLISLSESLAIVGLVVPGVVMMTAIGAMMGSGILPFWETLLWAILGAIAGDGISYWLGYHYHEHLRDFWPFRQFPQLLIRGEKFFVHHGGKSIIFGRFVGPVRPMIPVIAGMMDMSPRRFLFFNIVSAIAWAPLYSLPGILIGASLGTLSPEVGRRIVFLILAGLFALWIIYAFLLKIGVWIGKLILNTINHLWRHIQASQRLKRLHPLLITQQGHEESQVGILLLFIVSASAFALITFNLIHSEMLADCNESIYQALRALYTPVVIQWTILFTGLGDPNILMIVTTAIILFFLWHQHYRAAFCWLLTIASGMGIGHLLRDIIAINRPEGLYYLAQQHSYPSGHALSATLVYGLAAAYMHSTLAPKHRYIPWAIAIPLIILIGLSRLYLGVHWFSDILGGFALGIAGVTAGIFIFRYVESKPPAPRSILIPGLTALLLSMLFYSFWVYPKKKTELARQWAIQPFKREHWWMGQTPFNELHRSGAFKRVATIFNIQWLGTLDTIESILKQKGWTNVPHLNFNSSLMFLVTSPTPETTPVLPKFHRDRLPVLVVMQSEHPNERLLLQLWQSDYIDQDGLSLWVGTLRLETLQHPFPMLTFFLETPPKQPDSITRLVQQLQTLKVPYRILNKGAITSPILLINTTPTYHSIVGERSLLDKTP